MKLHSILCTIIIIAGTLSLRANPDQAQDKTPTIKLLLLQSQAKQVADSVYLHIKKILLPYAKDQMNNAKQMINYSLKKYQHGVLPLISDKMADNLVTNSIATLVARPIKGITRDNAYSVSCRGLSQTLESLAKDYSLNEKIAQLLGNLATGLIATILTQPWRVLKTTVQSTFKCSIPPSIIATAKNMYSTQGISGFFKGVQAQTARVSGIIIAIRMLAYQNHK